MNVFVIILLTIFLFGYNIFTNYYHFKNYLITVYLNCFLAYLIYDRSNAIFALTALYLLTSSSYYYLNIKSKHFSHPEKGHNHSFLLATGKSYIFLVISCLFFIFIPKLEMIFAIKVAHIINILLTLIPAKYTEFKTETAPNAKSPICGFGANVSVNGTLLSLMSMIFLIDYHPNYSPFILIFTLIAIAKTHATAGLISFIASILIYLFFKIDIGHYLLTISCIFLLFILNMMIIKKINPRVRLLSVSGRDNIFRFTEKWIRPRMNKFTGTGIGSMTYIFPATHIKMIENSLNQFKIANYVWLHSDIYQFFIEGGIIGISLVFAALSYSLFQCYNYSLYGGIAFIVCYLCNSAINFPNHMVPDVVTCLLFFSIIGGLPCTLI